MDNSSTNLHENVRQSESETLKKYYREHDLFLSAEGILKFSSVIVCIISSVLFLRGESCAGAPALVQSSTTVALACGVAMALLYAGGVFNLPLYAPQIWLFTDIIVSSVMGVLLLVTAILSMTVCELRSPIDYVHGPLAIVNSAVVTSSNVITYVSVIKIWETARSPLEPHTAPPGELDV